MDTQPAYGLKDLLAHIIGDMAQAVAERPGESPAQRSARAQAAVQTILGFLPCDAIEAMIAGHCVMLHEVIVDSVLRTLRGEPDATRRATRANIVAMDKAFGNNLIRLRQHRARLAEAAPDARPANDLAETNLAEAGIAETGIADRVRRHESRARAEAVAPEPAWPDDATQFPRIPNQDQPAAAQTTGLNRQARRAIDRQARKRVVPVPAGQPRTPGSGLTPTRNGPISTISATAAD